MVGLFYRCIMITTEIKGDLVQIFGAGENIIHGCNCFHMMSAGVAGALATKYPFILDADKAHHKRCANVLGQYSEAWMGDNVCINMYTQYNGGKDLSYQAVYDGFKSLNDYWAGSGERFFLPKIGAGIAGGDWEAIKVIINAATPNVQLVLVNWG